MHFLITGHTGFKGTWLIYFLKELGHEVSGISLDPIKNSLFITSNASELLKSDLRVDIRNENELSKKMESLNPDVLIHLAAQPLVRKSYLDPRETIETNAIGTFNILESAAKIENLKANLIITTDKVYKNVNQIEGYVESDPLGGDDPYSVSKAMADLVTQSYVKSFKMAPTAIARAGNVIGGGDVSQDRLIPDLIKGFEKNEIVKIRFPQAVRPWQHVLDCLNGYITLTENILHRKIVGEWNFGPDKNSFKTVGEVADFLKLHWGENASWRAQESIDLAEAELLSLNAAKAQKELGWRNKLTFEETLLWTLNWHKQAISSVNPRAVTQNQIRDFLKL